MTSDELQQKADEYRAAAARIRTLAEGESRIVLVGLSGVAHSYETAGVEWQRQADRAWEDEQRWGLTKEDGQ